MTQSFSLPPGCQIRPARLSDYPAILSIRAEFGRSLQPPGLQSWLQFTSAYLPVAVLGIMVSLLAIAMLLTSLFLVLLLLGVMLIVVWLEVSASWVVECQGQVVAQATLYLCEQHSELYSLCVLPQWRHRGIGSSLVQHLTFKATLPLYLAARSDRVGFYTRLGFRRVASEDLPDAVRKSLGIERYQEDELVALVARSPQRTLH